MPKIPKVSTVDATAKRMNAIAKKLVKARRDAFDQIGALGWPIDIYYDFSWYPELHCVDTQPSSKQKKSQGRATKLRESILEIDYALVAMNHYAETAPATSTSDKTDAIIEALDAAINAITAYLKPDADIGEKQRINGARGGRSSERLQDFSKTHKRWVEEDAELKISRPRLSQKARSIVISKAHNAHPKYGIKQVKSETVRSAIRRLDRKLLS